GENANGLARLQQQAFARAGRETPGHRKCRVAVRPQIRVPYGIAVHGRIIEGRQVDRSFHLVRQNAAARAMQRHFFGLSDRSDPLADQPLHIIEPEQRPGECKAIVGELRHYRPLAAAVASAAPTATARLSNRSAMASMSLRSITGTFACANAMSDAIATICGSSGRMSGLPLASREIFSLGKASRLNPSTSTRSTGDIFATRPRRSHSGSSRSSCRMAQRVADEMITSVAPAARWKNESLPG